MDSHQNTKRMLRVELSVWLLRAQYAHLYYLVPGYAAVTTLALVVEGGSVCIYTEAV